MKKSFAQLIVVPSLAASLFLAAYGLHAQGGLSIGSGAQVVATGSPRIVIANGKWQNDGVFSAGASLVRMEGTASTVNSAISGASSTTFFDLTQQKTTNDVLLNTSIGVTNNFTMAGGLFQLNGFVVTLGTASGQLVSESEINRVTGTTGGEIIKTMTLTAPAGVNPGNLGATITSAANLGSTTIRRGHLQQTDLGTGISIFRYFDISPTTNAGLNASLRMQYFDAELGTINESELEHFSSVNNTNWNSRSRTTINTSSNFVDNVGYDDFFSRWTLGSAINQPLPVVFVDEGLSCKEEGANLFWVVLERAGSDYFQVQGSEDEVTWTSLVDGQLQSRGTGRNRYEIELTESANFFRVQQYDIDGAINLSESHRRTCNVAGAWSLWPNPTFSNLNIKAPFGKEIEGVEVLDMMGHIVYQQHSENPNLSTMELKLEDMLPSGMYLAKIFPTQGGVVVKKFELR